MAYFRAHAIDEDGWTDWVQPVEQGYKMACCDCGLVHEMDFRVYDGRVQFRARRSERSTAMKRRWRRIRADSTND